MLRWLSWVFVVLGIWSIVSPWVLMFSGDMVATWSAVILGIVVGVFGLCSYFFAAGREPGGTRM